jgi:4-hydroxy-tetrahydrodipicolinate synthase
LSHEEHKRVVEICVEQIAGRVPVIAGAGSNSTREAIELALHAEKAGADGVLVVTPYYNKPNQQGLYEHYKAVAEAVSLPVIIYNIPPRSVVDMSVETMARLAELPNIVGVKDATGNLARVPLQRAACGHDFIQLSGEDGTSLAFNAQGGVGCISVASNIAPRQTAAFHRAFAAGDMELALKIHDQLTPLYTAIFSEPNPVPTKFALYMMGMMQPDVRLPMVPLEEKTKEIVRQALKTSGILA